VAHYELKPPITEAQARVLRVNDTVTLQGTLFGIRDATQIHMFDRARKTRFDLAGHAVIHTAPNVKKVENSAAHPAGYAPPASAPPPATAWNASRGRSCSRTACASSSARAGSRGIPEAFGIRRRLPGHHRRARRWKRPGSRPSRTWISTTCIPNRLKFRVGLRPAGGRHGQPRRQSVRSGQEHCRDAAPRRSRVSE
jgi:hypothetical protein